MLSVWNCYIFKNKPTSYSVLDWASKPLTQAFGGKQIHVKTGKQAQVSICKRITQLFICLLLFPVFILSAASLLLKKITWKSQSKLISAAQKKQQAKEKPKDAIDTSEQQKEALATFLQEEATTPEDVEALLTQWPLIQQDPQFQLKLLTILTQLVQAKDLDFDQFSKIIPLFADKKAATEWIITVIDRISIEESETDSFFLEPEEVIALLEKTFKTKEQWMQFHERFRLFTKQNTNLTEFNVIKLDFAHILALHYKQLNSVEPLEIDTNSKLHHIHCTLQFIRKFNKKILLPLIMWDDFTLSSFQTELNGYRDALGILLKDYPNGYRELMQSLLQQVIDELKTNQLLQLDGLFEQINAKMEINLSNFASLADDIFQPLHDMDRRLLEQFFKKLEAVLKKMVSNDDGQPMPEEPEVSLDELFAKTDKLLQESEKLQDQCKPQLFIRTSSVFLSQKGLPSPVKLASPLAFAATPPPHHQSSSAKERMTQRKENFQTL